MVVLCVTLNKAVLNPTQFIIFLKRIKIKYIPKILFVLVLANTKQQQLLGFQSSRTVKTNA